MLAAVKHGRAPILTAIGACRLRQLIAADVHPACRGAGSRRPQCRHARRHAQGPGGAAKLEPDGGPGVGAGSGNGRDPDARLHRALCLSTGIRTDEARALPWEHVDVGDPDADPLLPASEPCGGQSDPTHGDAKPEKCRRTLALPGMAVGARRAQKQRQADDRRAAS